VAAAGIGAVAGGAGLVAGRVGGALSAIASAQGAAGGPTAAVSAGGGGGLGGPPGIQPEKSPLGKLIASIGKSDSSQPSPPSTPPDAGGGGNSSTASANGGGQVSPPKQGMGLVAQGAKTALAGAAHMVKGAAQLTQKQMGNVASALEKVRIHMPHDGGGVAPSPPNLGGGGSE
jgi:hypothetical protein